MPALKSCGVAGLYLLGWLVASDSKDANFSSKPSVLFKMPALSNLLSKKVNKQLDFF